jgi:hypothetical protein
MLTCQCSTSLNVVQFVLFYSTIAFLGVVVVTSSLIDALAIYERTGMPAVSLPCGMHRVPPDTLFYLEKWEKAVVWFGNDPQSWPAVRSLARKLGESRCYYVSPALWSWGPYKALAQKANVSKIVSEARPVSHKDIASFPNLREHVKAELTLIDQVSQICRNFRPRFSFSCAVHSFKLNKHANSGTAESNTFFHPFCKVVVRNGLTVHIHLQFIFSCVQLQFAFAVGTYTEIATSN